MEAASEEAAQITEAVRAEEVVSAAALAGAIQVVEAVQAAASAGAVQAVEAVRVVASAAQAGAVQAAEEAQAAALAEKDSLVYIICRAWRPRHAANFILHWILSCVGAIVPDRP